MRTTGLVVVLAALLLGGGAVRAWGGEEDEEGSRLSALEARVEHLEHVLLGERQRVDRLEDMLRELLRASRPTAPPPLEDLIHGAMRSLHERLDAMEDLVREVRDRLAKEEAPAEPPSPPAGDPETLEKDLKQWIARLAEPNEDIRFAATLELGRLKDPRSVAPLLDILAGDRDFYVRLGAAAALGDIRAADAVPGLIEALDDADELVRTAAKDALHAITGHDEPAVADADDPRAALIRAWKTWWEGHEEEVREQLAR